MGWDVGSVGFGLTGVMCAAVLCELMQHPKAKLGGCGKVWGGPV